jgi:tetratricopeptide (TPR) repeat protein
MAEVKDITKMCRDGKVQEAYELAKKDLSANPDYPWLQRSLGWALYYLIKGDADKGDYAKLVEHIDELKSLDQLTLDNDSMIFDNVQFQIANYIKNRVFLTDLEAPSKLSEFFRQLKDYAFKPSRGHSFLLQTYIKFENWPEMADFLDWWNLDNLTPDDYKPFVNQKGQKMMTLAERAFIANSKALLRLNDTGRIEEFLPKMDTLMNKHEEMMYPGYFYGKLLLKLGSNVDEALKVIIPFARKKQTEFWVWQLLSDVFTNDEEKQLACLLRAVHCHTQESFLGKVRIKLATLYIKRRQFNSARYHIDAITRCYATQGWRLPYEIECWIHQPWFNSTTADGNDQIDYMSITDAILCDGAEECIAVVTYVDQNSHKSSMIYGYEKRVVQKIRFKVQAGNILKLHYITDKDGKMRVLSSTKVQLPSNLNYTKNVEGTIDKRDDKEFAFLKAGSVRCFVAPAIVIKYNLKNGDNIRSLIVYDYDKKKESWNWVCVNIKK